MEIAQFGEAEISVFLDVRINEVIGIDRPCPEFDPLRPKKGAHIYYVTLWVDPDFVCETPWVFAKGSPKAPYLTWSSSSSSQQAQFRIELNPEKYSREELKLEVIRAGCFGEIGTSSGNVVVGRATIKISDVSKGRSRCHRVDLVRMMMESLECRMEGEIVMDMEVSIRRPFVSWL